MSSASAPVSSSTSTGTERRTEDRSTRPFRALVFPAGGFDTAMQLGVIHALMVSEGSAPDAVAGVSAGAVNAAALAEVLREPQEQRVGRFREFLNAYRDAPRELRMAFLPDAYEIDAQAPLESLNLPIHCKDERKERDNAVASKTGLIRVLNMLLSVRISVSVITRFIHCILKYSAATEEKALKRVWSRFWAFQEIWLLALLSLPCIAPVSWQAMMAVVYPSVGKKDSLPCPAPIFHKVRVWLGLTQGKSAGQIISFRRLMVRKIIVWGKHLLGFLFSVVVWALAPAVWVLVPKLIRVWRWCVSEKSPLTLSIGQWLLRRFLARFDLDKEIADAYPLKQFLVRLFDPHYYGPLQRDDVVERALGNDKCPASRGKQSRKTLGHYTELSNGSPSIHVVPVVTTLADSRSHVPPPKTSVVEALLAATAVVPFFKPVGLDLKPDTKSKPPEPRIPSKEQILTKSQCTNEVKGVNEPAHAQCIDAVNVANEPALALIEYLRNVDPSTLLGKKVDEASSIHIYAVSSIPTTKPPVSAGDRTYTRLVDIGLRVLELRRYQTATLERKLAKLYTRLLPKTGARHTVKVDGKEKRFLSAHIFPIEPQQPTRLNERLILAKTDEEKEKVLFETIAAGCRATHEVLLQPSIAKKTKSDTIPCRQVMQDLVSLAGSKPEVGPGLAEICERCRAVIANKNSVVAEKHRSESVPQALRVLPDKPESSDMATWPLWPHKSLRDSSSLNLECKSQFKEDAKRTPSDAEPDTNPWTTLLFSGGVFRGVFQVGVLNALVEVGASPRVFAGSSVGTIMAAMAARLFTEAPQDRPARVVEVASTFLALDRLILTDRFADFVRRLTIRAAAGRFSFHDMDQLFRRYDTGLSGGFSADARRVIGGIERLLYISPFELLELVKAIRLQDTSKAFLLIRRYLQEFLERYHTGMEILGAEPLAMIVAEHVLKGLSDSAADAYYANPHRAPFDLFKKHGAFLIATTTNLTTGTLTTIGKSSAWNSSAGKPSEPWTSLLEALLASSAFPAVFRPRRSSEVFPLDSHKHQYVDGGIMDNLPLDAVVSFLDDAASAGRILRRPRAPHLLLSGLLEPELVPFDQNHADTISSLWPTALTRTKQLSYNRKAEMFAEAQRDLGALYEDPSMHSKCGTDWEPLNIEVLNVKPKWLCSTFGFHPMLGFRRRKQAASIAHGCASTLLTLHQAQQKHRNAWGFDLQFDVKALVENRSKDGKTTERLVPPQGDKQPRGACWFRSDGKVCPFSQEGIDDLISKNLYTGKQQTRKEVEMIYQLCGQAETHAPQ